MSADTLTPNTASSRIFVRNLPPNITDAEFRAHFSGSKPKGKSAPTSSGQPFKGILTDAKLIPHRRIGYVGYKSPEDAEAAAAFFDRTYIRLSRVTVELAKPYGAQDLEDDRMKRARKRRGDNEDRDGKRICVDDGKPDGTSTAQPTPLDPKLDEYLQVMGGKKGKAWANGQDPSLASAAQADEIMPLVEEVESEEEDAYEMVSKPAVPRPSDVSTEPEVPLAQQPVSDLDWLRSVTIPSNNAEAASDDNALLASGEPGANIGVATDSIATGSTPKPTTGAAHQEPTPISTIEKTGRLFFRNLPYATNAEELEELLKPFENLEEVSFKPQFPHFNSAHTVSPLASVMNPDRDKLCICI